MQERQYLNASAVEQKEVSGVLRNTYSLQVLPTSYAIGPFTRS